MGGKGPLKEMVCSTQGTVENVKGQQVLKGDLKTAWASHRLRAAAVQDEAITIPTWPHGAGSMPLTFGDDSSIWLLTDPGSWLSLAMGQIFLLHD